MQEDEPIICCGEEAGQLGGFMNREQLSRELGITTRTLDRWAETNAGPPRIVIGRVIRYRVSAVKEWMGRMEKA